MFNDGWCKNTLSTSREAVDPKPLIWIIPPRLEVVGVNKPTPRRWWVFLTSCAMICGWIRWRKPTDNSAVFGICFQLISILLYLHHFLPCWATRNSLTPWSISETSACRCRDKYLYCHLALGKTAIEDTTIPASHHRLQQDFNEAFWAQSATHSAL